MNEAEMNALLQVVRDCLRRAYERRRENVVDTLRQQLGVAPAPRPRRKVGSKGARVERFASLIADGESVSRTELAARSGSSLASVDQAISQAFKIGNSPLIRVAPGLYRKAA